MLDYKYTESSAKVKVSDQRLDQGVQRNNTPGMYTSVHSGVFQESYPFDLFNLPLEVLLVWEINQGYMDYVSLWIPLI